MNTFKKISPVLLISIATLFVLILNIVVFTPLAIQSALENMEAKKVWGEENYKIMQELFESDKFKDSQKQSLQTAIQQMAWTANPTADTANPPHGQPWHKEDGETPTEDKNIIKKIPLDEVKKIRNDSIIMWDKNAKILIVEYSDLQCPFCKKHFEAGTLSSIVKKYDGKVAKTLRHFPLWFHQYAPKAAEGMECFANGDTDKYFQYAWAIFAKDINSNGSDTTIFTVNKELWGNESEFKKCIDSGKYTQRVSDQMAEWSKLFGVSGTPWNVIINTESGEYILVSGAYPISEFETIINKWIQ